MTTTVRTEGGLLPADLLARIEAGDRDVPGLADVDYEIAAGDRTREAITRSWNRLVGAWAALTGARVGAADAHDPLTTPTRERWLLPLLEELGFGRLAAARTLAIEATAYPISHIWGPVPIHLVGFGVELDRRTPGVRGAAGAAPHALVQEYLNRSEASLWGLVSNGRYLRLLRDSTSLTRQAFVEFDLESMFEGELFADFALLWSVCHRTRFEGEKPEECLLERWSRKAAEDGTRALEKLRGGVERAIEILGAGFLAHPSNGELREALRGGALERQDYYRELLRLVYRLIFLFAAEDRRDEETGRELLLDPSAPVAAVERYRRFYSTARLRLIAGRKRGTRHGDLWVSLRRIVAALGADGTPSLALPALGSFLFGANACPDLDGADLRNEDLLDAVRALATIEEDRRLRLVDYRNLGAEELGGIYEGLLERHPRIELDGTPPRFSLESAAGNERKSTGSYYTPSSLISCLLDSALDPVVDFVVTGRSDAADEAAILGLAIVDPAAGSGHFLVAAAHRLAKRLASVRTGELEPPPGAIRHALRDVIAHCIYAVDVNPMAVELCKVSLWLEALEPGKPLSFLDAHVKCGNSLLGTTPELVEAGIPNAAFQPLIGDDRTIVRDWRNRNGRERTGQQSLLEGGVEIPTSALAAQTRELDGLAEDSVSAVAAKAAAHARFLASSEYHRSRSALDAWCTSFVAPKTEGATEITSATVRALATDPARVPPAAHEVVHATAGQYAFFHWHLEFPAVFDRGGFDVVLGNPPWERVKLQEKEFFAEREPDIAGARNAAVRKIRIAELRETDPALWQSFQDALHRSDSESHFLRNSGRFPLAARGDINTYAVFAELMRSLLGPSGRVGLIVPTGIATDDTTKFFFSEVVERRALVSLLSFENEEFVFPAIHHATKFCLLTLSSYPVTEPADLLFFARQVADLADEDRHFSLAPGDFALINPNTKTCPTFRSRRDARIAIDMHSRLPILVREGGQGEGGWEVTFSNVMFHMANDAAAFHDTRGPATVPLYESKMFSLFDHRFGTYEGQSAAQRSQGILPRCSDEQKLDRKFEPAPNYWVSMAEVNGKLATRWDREWLLAWRNITSAVSARTMVSAVLPRVGVANSATVAFPAGPYGPLLLGNLNAMVLDWAARQRVGGVNLSLYMVQQLPVLPPKAYTEEGEWYVGSLGAFLRPYLAELVFTADSVGAWARELGWVGPPFMWDAERRAVLTAELDAAYFRLYHLDRDDVAHVLDSFWIVRDRDVKEFEGYRTKELVLRAYDAMTAATTDHPFASRLDPPPGDPRAAHGALPGEQPGRWMPWTDVIAEAVAAQAASTVATASPSRDSSGEEVVLRPARGGRIVSGTKPTTAPTQQTIAAVLLDATTIGRWRPEATVTSADVLTGMRVRHTAFGPGNVLTINEVPGPIEILIRFDSGVEKWIAFGFGLLEFQV